MKSVLSPKNRTVTQKTWSKNGTRSILAHQNETFSHGGYPPLSLDQRVANTRAIKTRKYKDFMNKIPMTSSRMKPNRYKSIRTKGEIGLPNCSPLSSPRDSMFQNGAVRVPAGLQMISKTAKNSPMNSPQGDSRQDGERKTLMGL
jgi:hypothetical protein